jgi:hypothetical protein
MKWFQLFCITIVLSFPSWLKAQSVTLEWDPNPPEETVIGYNLYRSNQPGTGYVKVNAALIEQVTFQDTTIQPGDQYYYVATAENDVGESGYSNEVSFRFICRGDPSQDNQRTVLDAVLISQHITGNNILTGYALEAADTNGNGVVTVADLTLVHQYIAGIYSLESCQ